MEAALFVAGLLFTAKSLQKHDKQTADGKPLKESPLETVSLANSRRVARYPETDVRRQTYAREDKIASMPNPMMPKTKLTAPSGTENEYRYWTATPLSEISKDYDSKLKYFQRQALWNQHPNHVHKDRYSNRGVHTEEFTDNPDHKFIRAIFA